MRSRAAKICDARSVAWTEYVLPLHGALRRPDAGKAQHGWRVIDGADEVVIHGPGAAAVGKADHQRKVNAAIIEKLLAAEQRAVVAGDHDNGILRETFALQTLEQLAHVLIGKMNGIQVVRVLIARDGAVGVVRGQL